jgi:hypothetical protein
VPDPIGHARPTHGVPRTLARSAPLELEVRGLLRTIAVRLHCALSKRAARAELLP